jgi:hypothetical protein
MAVINTVTVWNRAVLEKLMFPLKKQKTVFLEPDAAIQFLQQPVTCYSL